MALLSQYAISDPEVQKHIGWTPRELVLLVEEAFNRGIDLEPIATIWELQELVRISFAKEYAAEFNGDMQEFLQSSKDAVASLKMSAYPTLDRLHLAFLERMGVIRVIADVPASTARKEKELMVKLFEIMEQMEEPEAFMTESWVDEDRYGTCVFRVHSVKRDTVTEIDRFVAQAGFARRLYAVDAPAQHEDSLAGIKTTTATFRITEMGHTIMRQERALRSGAVARISTPRVAKELRPVPALEPQPDVDPMEFQAKLIIAHQTPGSLSTTKLSLTKHRLYVTASGITWLFWEGEGKYWWGKTLDGPENVLTRVWFSHMQAFVKTDCTENIYNA